MIISTVKKESVAEFVIDSKQFYLFASINEIAEDWDQITADDLYFSSGYLKVIEMSPSLGIKPFYLLECEGEKLVAVYYYQLKAFRLDESMAGNQSLQSNSLKKHISKLVRFSTLINGNLLLTGKYGYYNPSTESINIQNLEKVNTLVCDKITQISKSKPQGFLVKDFYQTEIEDSNYKGGFTPCIVHPNMIMEIDSQWKTYDDYLSALNTKYRTRVKRAQKKLNGIISRELTLEEIIALNGKIVQLYKNIAQNADFNLFILPDDYFVQLKKVFQEKLIIRGYFKEDILVGFFTCLNNYSRLDAHFLGYDLQVNSEHQLYLNMLLNMIQLGIENNCFRVFMSRTAIEIKNSVGAIPHDMLCFFRYNHMVINKMVKPIFEYYKPEKTYVLRSPFKNSETAEQNDLTETEEKCGLRKILCKK